MDQLAACQWIASCAAGLGERWRTVLTSELKAASVEIWRDEKLRELEPRSAASQWLAPVGGAGRAAPP